jgi:hypothetical protein
MRFMQRSHRRAPVRVPIPPAPLAFRPLDGRPPRPRLGDWRERVVPARWRLAPAGAAGERPVRSPAASWHAGRAPIAGRHDGRADALLVPSG